MCLFASLLGMMRQLLRQWLQSRILHLLALQIAKSTINISYFALVIICVFLWINLREAGSVSLRFIHNLFNCICAGSLKSPFSRFLAAVLLDCHPESHLRWANTCCIYMHIFRHVRLQSSFVFALAGTARKPQHSRQQANTASTLVRHFSRCDDN